MQPLKNVRIKMKAIAVYIATAALLLMALPIQADWQHIPGTMQVQCMTTDTAGKLYVGTNENLLTTTGPGAGWDTIQFPLSVLDIFTLLVTPDSGTLFAAAEPGLFKSTDGGATMVLLDLSSVAVYSLAADNSGHIFGAGAGGVVRSSDNGATWAHVSGIAGTANDGLLCTPSGHIFLSSNGLFHSSDTGVTWDSVPGVPGFITSMTVSPVTGTVLVGTEIFGTTTHAQIYRSTTNGSTWAMVRDSGNVIDALYADSSGTMYAGVGSVIRSADDGLTWQHFGEGIPADAQVVAFARADTVLVAGDRNDGVFYDNGQSGIAACPDAGVVRWSRLGPGRPNPFARSIEIDFTLGRRAHVRLVICDMLGRRVGSLVDGPLGPGSHSATWDARAYPSGVYLARLEAGGSRQHRRVVLLR
jgi:photosystem II stability/assembly factor-like uncharacterized protein